MKDPVFLKLDRILELHRLLIAQFGGEPGLRDRGLLQSALGMPQAGLGDQYFHKNLHEMAAAYFYHLAQNHPFVDENKRVGAAAAVVFLKMNGVSVTATDEALAGLTLAVAQGKTEKPAIAAFLRKHSRKTPR